ncbi:enolase-like [Silene latifolia]|uniref:enolase-like n=1 Tax=Silene latifolia TaxID=37657 RepID=UPI003D77BECE
MSFEHYIHILRSTLQRTRKVLSCSRQTIEKVVIGMNVAASEFYKEDKSYDLHFKEVRISGEPLKDLYKSFAVEYHIVSIEDPFDQDDWEHYAKMTAEIGDKVQIDNLLMTAEIGLS